MRARILPDAHPRVVVIGGAPRPHALPQRWGGGRAIARFIDASDCVVRMNDLKNRRKVWVGRRTDIQIVTNGGLPGARHGRKRIGGWGIAPPREIWWSFSQAEIDAYSRLNARPVEDVGAIAARILSKQGWEDLPASETDVGTATALSAALGFEALGTRLASAGMRAVWRVLHDPRFAGWHVHALGFSWAGWEGHPFDAESRLSATLHADGRLTPLHYA